MDTTNLVFAVLVLALWSYATNALLCAIGARITRSRDMTSKKSKVDIEDPIGEAMSPGELAEYEHEARIGSSFEAYQEEGIERYAAEVAQGATLEAYMEGDIRAYTDASGYAELAEVYDGPAVQADLRAPGEEYEVEVDVEVGPDETETDKSGDTEN